MLHFWSLRTLLLWLPFFFRLRLEGLSLVVLRIIPEAEIRIKIARPMPVFAILIRAFLAAFHVVTHDFLLRWDLGGLDRLRLLRLPVFAFPCSFVSSLVVFTFFSFSSFSPTFGTFRTLISFGSARGTFGGLLASGGG